MSDQHDPSTFDRAAQFVSEMWHHDGPASEMHVGDLAWGTFNRWPNAIAALRLWTDGSGRIQALTMFDSTGVCDLVVRPGDLGLRAAAEALTWAESERASAAIGPELVELRVGRRLRLPGLVELLHARGFTRLGNGVPAMSRTISASVGDQRLIPDGCEIRAIRTEDLASRSRAFDAAFPGESMSIDAYRALRDCSVYLPALDIVAVSAPSRRWCATWTQTTQLGPSIKRAVSQQSRRKPASSNGCDSLEGSVEKTVTKASWASASRDSQFGCFE